MKTNAPRLVTGFLLAATAFPLPNIAKNARVARAQTAPAIAVVSTLKTEWRDFKRDRAVPVTLHFPQQGAGPFPLLIISHGLGGTRDGLDYLGNFWASHGYVCAQIQHVGSDESVWRGAPRPMAAMRAAAKNPKAINDRPLDVKFAIDEMLKLHLDPKSALFGRIDGQKIGAAGHSFGAFTAQAVAGRGLPGQKGWRDARVIASIALSAPSGSLERSRAQYGAFKTPFYLLTGTKDDSPLGEGKAADRRVPFDAIIGVEGYLLTLDGANHATFGGGVRLTTDATHQGLILGSTLLFWDAYLKGDARAKTALRSGVFARELGAQGVFEIK